ncbi:tetratricopeptide repeat protein [Chloroflexota bacterium]
MARTDYTQPRVVANGRSIETATWRARGVLYVLVASLVCYSLPLSALVRALLALPAVVILPLQLGSLLLKVANRWIPELPTARNPIARGLIGWWTGLVLLAGLANALQHLGLFALLKPLPWLVLGILAAYAIYGLVRSGGWARLDLDMIRDLLRNEWPILAALLLGFTPLWIHKRAFPFPIFMRNSFTLANMVYQPVERLLRDGYLTFEPSHKTGSYLLIFLPSALSNVDPLAMAWSLPFLQVAVFALGLYLWAYEVSRSRLLAVLVPLFGGFVLSAGPLFETTPLVFRSNSVQLALLPLTLWVLHRYADRRPSSKGLALPVLLSAAGFVGWFAVIHSDKLFWPGCLLALYPGQDLVRLMHLYGVEWSARTAAVFGWLALPVLFLVRALFGRDHPHRDLVSLFFLLTAFQFQLHAWEAPIFLGIAWAYLVAKILLKQRALHPFAYVVIAGIWLFWFLQWAGVITLAGSSPLFDLLFFWVSVSPNIPRVTDLVEILRNAHAPLTLGLWALGMAGMLAQRKQAGLLISLMATLGLFVYFLPEPNGVRAYKVIIPFAAYTLAWIVAQTYQTIARCRHKIARSLSLVAFAAALIYLSGGLVQPFQLYYTRSQPGERYTSYMADYEELALSWLRENLPENARLISDPHSTHLFSELTNSIDPLEHAMTTTEMSSVGQRQVTQIKEDVFRAKNSLSAYRALHTLAQHELSFHNRDYAQKTGRTSDPTLLVLLSGKTSQWIAEPGIDALYAPVIEPVDPAHLAPLDDLRYFRLRYQDHDYMLIFEARQSNLPQAGTALYWVEQGNERWFAGQEGGAIALYQKALQLDPQETEAYIALGEAYRCQGHWEATIQMLQGALQLAPDDADLHRVLGDTYLVNSEPRKAISAYQRAIQLAPDNPGLHARLGDAYQVQGDEDAAGQAYARSTQSPYGQAESLVRLGHLYVDKGLVARAEQAYREALDLNPRLTIAHQGLAHLYRAQDRAAQAQDVFQRLIELDPHQSLWHAELRQLYVEQERPEAAVAFYEKAIKRYPREKEFHLALGELYLSLAKAEGRSARQPWLEKSIAVLERAHNLDARHRDILSLLSQAYQAQGETQKAVILLQTTAGNYPDLISPHLLLGELYESQENWQDAIAAYEHAIETDPTSAQPYLALANLYDRRGTWTKADALYRQAMVRGDARAYPQANENDSPNSDTVDSLFDQPNPALDGTLIKRTVWYIDDRPQRTIFQHPTSRIGYRVQIPPGAEFVSSLALQPDIWQPERGDGVLFEVHIAEQDLERRVFSQYIDPKNVPSDRRWHDLKLDLAPWAGRTVTLTLSTAPGSNGDARYDWAGWGEPRITQRAFYDFLDQFDQAHADAVDPHIRRTSMTINDVSRQILFQHPSSRVVYPQVRVSDNATLYFGVGIDPQVWSADMGDGIEFQIWVQDTSQHKVEVYSQYLDPKHNPEHRRWFDVQIDLDRFAGQTVGIHFVTLPGPAGDERYDWGGWSTPTLVAASPAEQSNHDRP